jgi:dienelactone hydrolase
MSTKILDSQQNKPLQPAHGLWQQYRPENARYAFRAKTLLEAQAWQVETKKALAQTIGLPLDDSALNPQLLESVDKGDYVREKILLQTGAHTLMPVYLLLPKAAQKPLPVVLAFHGHGYGVKDIVGLWEDGEERDTPDGYHKDFGVELCRAGFAVAAPEIACFGERQTDFSCLNTALDQPVPSTCTHSAMLAFHLGTSVVGMRVHDGMRLVDYLETRPELDIRRLGAMGISGGGMHTFFSTCLDERIRACVVSGYFCTFRDSILAMSHCACNFVPGLGQFGEMYDLAGLIAPRPMLVESGNYDNIFPQKAVKASVSRADAVYEVFGDGLRIETDYFEGRHQISGKKAYGFLQAALGQE